MYLKPSKIHYSQDCISVTFGNDTEHAGKRIGETLDAILRGECNDTDIPTIKVFKKDGEWFTVNNRRLWIFKEAEKRGVLKKIPACKLPAKPENLKFTAKGGGHEVRLNGDVGGVYWRDVQYENQDDPLLSADPYLHFSDLPTSGSSSGTDSAPHTPEGNNQPVTIKDVLSRSLHTTESGYDSLPIQRSFSSSGEVEVHQVETREVLKAKRKYKRRNTPRYYRLRSTDSG